MSTPRFLGTIARLLLTAALALPTMADDIVVKEIGGVPVIQTKMRCGEKEIIAHLLLDMGLNLPLVIHEKTVGGFELSPEEAQGKPVDIEFPGKVYWKDIPMEVQEMRFLEVLTAKYAPELKEVPVVAVVGLPAIKNSVVELDLRRGLLRTLGMASEEARAQEFDYELKPYGIVLNGTGPNREPAKVLMSMRNEDSILDISLLRAARQAGHKPNVLLINEIPFSDHAAFRFESLDRIAPEPLDAVIGVSAMRNFTVTVWPKRRKIAFRPQANAVFPQAEQDYFLARVDKDPDGVEAFIAQKPGRRLMDEACLTLWQMRLEDPSSSFETLKGVLDTIAGQYDPKRCSTTLTSIADLLESGERADTEALALYALDLAMQRSKGALDPTAIHAVHVRLGKRAFIQGDLKKARRHMLSAAFGMPKNGECNFWMGEVYREMGKLRRAWSRYFQALLDPRVDPDILMESLACLDELNRDPEFRKTFNMVEAEQYMAGRLENAEFHAPSRYSLVRNKYPGHVKLVEFFTDAHLPETGGLELAFQALDEYFEGAVALVAYHLNDPMHSEVAANRLTYYREEGTPLAVFDGKPVLRTNHSEEEKLSDNAAANYPAFRDACLLEQAAPDPAWVLEATIAQDGTKVSGAVTVTGEGETDPLRLHAVLCERSVMALEDSGVFFHRAVARKALTPPEGLDLQTALSQPFTFSVDTEKMRERLTKMLGGADYAGSRSKPTYVDANKLMVVVFVQHRDDRRILAARSFGLPQEEDML